MQKQEDIDDFFEFHQQVLRDIDASMGVPADLLGNVNVTESANRGFDIKYIDPVSRHHRAQMEKLAEYHREQMFNMASLMPIGYTVVVDNRMCTNYWEQYRFPKSKKRRIRNKWEKNAKNFRMRETEYASMEGHNILVGPRTYKLLKEGLPPAKALDNKYNKHFVDGK